MPVPGSPTETLSPEVPFVYFIPFGPNEKDIPFFPIFKKIPGKIFIRLQNLIYPIIYLFLKA
jgi:hypothetical protein